VFGDKDVLAMLVKLPKLDFAPGAKYAYSNSGYFLLSQIVRKVSGQSLRDFAAENIFRPLGMATAQFRDDHSALVPNRARAYAARRGQYHHSEPNFDVVGAGGLFMSVRDFLPWDTNFQDPKVGGPELIAQLHERGKLADGKPLPYAFGLVHGTYRGLRLVEHNGSYGGYRATLIRFPEQRFSIACFCNLASMEPGKLARQVADLYLRDVMQPAATTAGAAKAR
jgi:CubicO group peptidase (beta-lactamase class C family)